MFLEEWQIREGQHEGQTHTMLYVATSANRVFAFSEDLLLNGNVAPLWSEQLAPASGRTGSNIPPPVGTCSTMVLDPANRRLFSVALTAGRREGVYRVYALDLDTGAILANVPIHDDGEPGRPTFVGADHDQRGALTLADGKLYITFADFLAYDEGPYRGWLVGCHADRLQEQFFFPVTRGLTGGGIWGPGGAAVLDGSIYVVSGNATGNTDDAEERWWGGLGPQTHPGDIGEFFEAVVRLDAGRNATASRWSDPVRIPGWFGNENQGGGVAVGDLDGDGKPELVAFHIDHPSGGDHGYYRIGWGLDATGSVSHWSDPVQVPGWFGNENQGGGVVLGDLNGDGRPELIVFHIDHSGGGNHGYYRVGWDLDAAGNASHWSDPVEVPGWFGKENQAGAVALADLDGDGASELIVFHIDHPSGGNHGYYRVGWGFDAAGNVSHWSGPVQIPGWFGNENQGGGIMVSDLDGDGRPELIVFHIDHPDRGNQGYYRIGWGLDAAGDVTGGWNAPVPIPGWFGNQNQGGGIAVAELNGDGRPELVVLHIDHPSGGNHAYYRIGWDLNLTDAFTVDDWYLPTDARTLNDNDWDLGGASALLLPPVDGLGEAMLVTSDKAGNVFLLDRNSLGHWGNEIWRSHSFHGEVRCAPAYYRTPSGRHHVFLSAHGTPGLSAFELRSDRGRPGLDRIWNAKDISGAEIGFGDAAGSPLVVDTERGKVTPSYTTVWILDGGDGVTPTLRAVAADDGREVFNSAWNPRDATGDVPHYPPMSCTSRSVFVGTKDGLACYSLPWLSLHTTTFDVVAFHVDHPAGGDHGYYRIGSGLGAAGNLDGGWTAPAEVPGWFGNENQAGSVAVADVNGDGAPELIVFHVDHPSGGNQGYYRIGWDLGVFGPTQWSDPIGIPGWFGNENQGGGVAVADLNRDGRPELIVFHIDHPSGGNHGYYRIGWDLDATAHASHWSDPVQIPGWFGNENQGGGVALGDLDGDGRPELIVFHIDHPSGGNHGYYRIGWGLDPVGNVTHWSDPVQIPGWFGNENQGGGVALGDLDGDGRPELVVFHIDHPSGGNHGYYRIGWDLDAVGNVTHWSDSVQIPGWFGNENQGGGVALAPRRWAWTWSGIRQDPATAPDLLMAWKGIPGDTGVYLLQGTSPLPPQAKIAGIGTSARPAAAFFGKEFHVAWKGVGDDGGIYWSSFDGVSWAGQQNVGGVGTGSGPALAVFDGRLYMAWRGYGDDGGIYWSSFDGVSWAGQQNVGGVGTGSGPAGGVRRPAVHGVEGIRGRRRDLLVELRRCEMGGPAEGSRRGYQPRIRVGGDGRPAVHVVERRRRRR